MVGLKANQAKPVRRLAGAIRAPFYLRNEIFMANPQPKKMRRNFYLTLTDSGTNCF
jgi:hypothetical protein